MSGLGVKTLLERQKGLEEAGYIGLSLFQTYVDLAYTNVFANAIPLKVDSTLNSTVFAVVYPASSSHRLPA